MSTARGPSHVLVVQGTLHGALEVAITTQQGGVLVCASVGMLCALKTPTNYFLVSLAAADVAMGLSASPFATCIRLGPALTATAVSCSPAWCSGSHTAPSSASRPWLFTAIWPSASCSGIKVWSLKPEQEESLLSSGSLPSDWFHSWGETGKDSATNNCTEPWDGSTNGSCCPVKCEDVVPMSYMPYFNVLGCVLPPLCLMLVISIFMVACRQFQLTDMLIKDHSPPGDPLSQVSGHHCRDVALC